MDQAPRSYWVQNATQQIEKMLSRVDSVDIVKSRGVYWLGLKEEQNPANSWPLCPAEARPARQIVQAEVDPREQTESSPGAASSDAPHRRHQCQGSEMADPR